jgi:predicted ATPase with chaperone activity
MSTAVDTQSFEPSLLSSLLTDDVYWPTEPRSLRDTGLGDAFVHALLLKTLLTLGTQSGRRLSELTGLPFAVVEPLLDTLRTRQLVVHVRPAPFNDYYYSLTEGGQSRANGHLQQCSYVGPAPVPLQDYVLSVEAQAAGLEAIDREQLRSALAEISHDEDLLDQLGPAINSNAGLFLYGPPGNGKTTIAKHLTRCLGQEVWIPHAVIEDGNLIKVFDEAYHRPAPVPQNGAPGRIVKLQDWDRRWNRIQRPTVVVGGELTLDNLEVRHDRRSNICEAPLQMKSNCGCLLIDDFGRQRIQPEELLNRWIIPLENRIDYLTLPTGKKIQIPFQQLIIFSTNINPGELVDEAFLRRVPYKVFVSDPLDAEYRKIFQLVLEQLGLTDESNEGLDHLMAFYQRAGRPMRRCHPRDLLTQVKHYCNYRKIRPQLRGDFLDRACLSYFSHL